MDRENITDIEILQRLSTIDLFSHLDTDMISNMLSGSKAVSLSHQEVLYTSHDACSNVSVVISGSLNILRTMSVNQDVVIRKVGTGETFGEVTALAGKTYPGWVVSAGHSRVLEIPVENILGLCRDEQFLRKLLSDISEKVLFLSEKIDLLSLGSLKEKLRTYLLRLYKLQGSEYLKIPSSRNSLAGELGCCRETLSRFLSRLEKLSIIEQRGKHEVRILDLNWLFGEEI